MRSMADATKIATRFVNEHPTDKSPSVNAVRSWTRNNITLSREQIDEVFKQVYGSGWQFGQLDAQAELGLITGDPWDNWIPGNASAAALVDPPSGLQQLLRDRRIVLAGIEASYLDRIGTQLATGLDQGLGIEQIAGMVSTVINDPARAMVIARTETARALVQSNLAQYRANGVDALEWLVGDPCDICAENEGQIVLLGEEFNSGDTEPPAHPNCVCDVAPVSKDDIPEEATTETPSEEPPSDTSVETASATDAENVIHEGVINEEPLVSEEPDLTLPEARLTPAEMDSQLPQIRADLLAKYNNDYDLIEGLRARDPSDKLIEAMWKAQGFNALPALVTEEQMAGLVEQGWKPTFRGVAAETPEKVQEFVSSYKTGETPFGGKGMFGNGTYAGSESTAEHFSQFTPEGKEVPHGEVMRMAMHPDSNYIEISKLREEWRAWRDEFYATREAIEQKYNYNLLYEPEEQGGLNYSQWLESLPEDVRQKWFEIDTLNYAYEDLGKFATSRGYDGYYIENPRVGLTDETVQDTYYVILNRGSVAIVQ